MRIGTACPECDSESVANANFPNPPDGRWLCFDCGHRWHQPTRQAWATKLAAIVAECKRADFRRAAEREAGCEIGAGKPRG